MQDFVQKLTEAIQGEAEVRAREAVLSAFGGVGTASRAPLVASGRSPAPVPKQRKTSSLRQKLAGRYMGLIKRMKKGEQKQIKGVRATQGVEAAIDLMTQMAAARG